MKRFVLFSLGLVFSLFSHQQEDFLYANQLCEAGEYAKALDVYTGLKKKGCGVFYNMGNAYYKNGQYFHALACWRAAQIRARGKELRHICAHIEKAKKKLNLKPSSILHTLAVATSVPLSHTPLLGLQLFWLMLMCVLITIWFKYTGTKRFSYMMFLTLLLGITVCVMKLKYTLLDDTHMVANDVIHIYAGPNEKYSCIGEIIAGGEVQRIDQSSEWYKVCYDGITGWIPAASIVTV